MGATKPRPIRAGNAKARKVSTIFASCLVFSQDKNSVHLHTKVGIDVAAPSCGTLFHMLASLIVPSRVRGQHTLCLMLQFIRRCGVWISPTVYEPRCERGYGLDREGD